MRPVACTVARRPRKPLLAGLLLNGARPIDQSPARPASFGLTTDPSTRSVPCLYFLPLLSNHFICRAWSKARQQPRRLAPHTGPSKRPQPPGPMADRIQIYANCQCQDSRLKTQVKTPGFETQDSGPKTRHSTPKQGICKRPHTIHQDHTGGEYRLLLSALSLLPGWVGSLRCTAPLRPMYRQGTGLGAAAQTVQHRYDAPRSMESGGT